MDEHKRSITRAKKQQQLQVALADNIVDDSALQLERNEFDKEDNNGEDHERRLVAHARLQDQTRQC